MAEGTGSLEQVLAGLAREGELYERLPDSRLRCYACGHRCLILPGQRGVCKVRWNEGGRLRVPWGYVAGLQLDPVEKKPFFHAYPGARALSFGMLGCDYHCGFCTLGSTLVATSSGPVPIKRLFDSAQEASGLTPASVRVPPRLDVYTHAGRARKAKALFRHHYAGRMVRLQPVYLLPLHVTPDHELLVVSEKDAVTGCASPRFVRAKDITAGSYLAVPRHFDFSHPTVFELSAILRPLAGRIPDKRTTDGSLLRGAMRLSQNGISSREIAGRLGKGGSHIRHLRTKAARGDWDLQSLSRPPEVLLEDARVRLSTEHAPGIPERVPLDEKLGALLGYYAAEGCVLRRGARGHSAVLVFALGHHEGPLAERIRQLLHEVFGVSPWVSRRQTILAVGCGKASLALLFESLCGAGPRRKRIPPELFSAPRSVVEAFLDAYIESGGYRDTHGAVAVSTASSELAVGVVWLLVKTGQFPSIKIVRQPREGKIRRRAGRLPRRYDLVLGKEPSRRRWLRCDERYFYVPLRRITTYQYEGFVYNLEVEDDHSYLAQFVSTHNCQNALTSQALRDPMAGVPPEEVTPAQIVDLAWRRRARILTSTYNEPLITSEWAVEVFRMAKARGLVCSYVSNGNATPEVLDYLRPWVDLYKVDLKGFDDRHYRKLGGLLATVLESIRRIHSLGFWLEVVTLVIPGVNDSDSELRDIAHFLHAVSPDIPWHVTAFHRDYKMMDRDDTTAATLIRAAEIGCAEGLRYVYAGNLPGRVGPFENTRCPSCGTLLIERVGYRILRDVLTPTSGVCPHCGARIPGVWS